MPGGGCTRPELQYGKKFFNRDRGVAENAANGAEGNFSVKGDRDGKTLRSGGVTKADVAALLAHHDVSKLPEGANR